MANEPVGFFEQLLRGLRSSVDEISLSTPRAAGAGGAARAGVAPPAATAGVAAVFPNTTAAIEREQAARAAMAPRDALLLEQWWARQFAAEAPGGGEALTPAPSDPRWAFEARIMHPSAKGVLRIVIHFVTEWCYGEGLAWVLVVYEIGHPRRR
jgi:hypothetical protein